MDMYGFYTGRCFDAYEYLGCHVEEGGVRFRTFAPAAVGVSVIGEFNQWKDTPMEKIYDGNFWECEIPQAKPGMLYKYRIYRRDGRVLDHCDPYGFGMELRPQNASVIRQLHGYRFEDEIWMKKRTDCKNAPLNIYEVHAGSWKKKTEAEDGWYNYRELGEQLIPYVKEMGYNYIELLPLGEYPSDASWGYQSTGFYSPTSRYGTCGDLQAFVDQCHQAEVGVILDFIPVHFAVDDYALADYDGTALYEYPHTDVGDSEWGSKNFNHSRGEVRSFLQSCANYWLQEYHFDGLRMDAISNMIYWQGNAARGVNRGAVDFLRDMNRGLKERNRGILLAAEDSTNFPGVTASWEQGGLGFDYKWDMGWMHDTLEYFQSAPMYRSRDYHKLTFSMSYFYQEQYLLPFSHDEVVHGKATVLQKMNGDYEGKFPQGRALYLYMYLHPGKKLNFMGGEFGQLREWDEKREQDWDLKKYPVHDAFSRFMKELNALYLEHEALWAKDYELEGFWWADCVQESRCIYAMVRSSGKERLLGVFNFSSERQSRYRLKLEKGDNAKSLSLLMDTDWEIYGGDTPVKEERFSVDEEGVVTLGLAAFSGRVFCIS